ncbi:MAG: NUDIX hydrolase [bacterium]|nr:NUDIX hydrolase [bacterium]
MVAGIIIEKGKVLLVHNTKHGSARVEPPGGKKEKSESLEQATRREVKEELGVGIKVGTLFKTEVTSSPEGDFNVSMFLCEIVSGEPKLTEPNKISNFRWYTAEEIKKEDKLVPNLVAIKNDLIALLN